MVRTTRVTLYCRRRWQNPRVSMRYSIRIPSCTISSLFTTTVPLLLYPRCHHPRQLFAAEGKRVYSDFAQTPFKGTTFYTLADFSLSLHPSATSQPTAPAMTIAPTAMHPACARMCAGGFMRTGHVCVSVVCMHVSRASVCRYMCICVFLCVATVELCSNCTKLRISVSDELRDLQYNCATSSLRPTSYPTSFRQFMPPHHGRKNYNLVRDICAASRMCGCVCIWYGGICMYMCCCARVHKQTRCCCTTPRSIGVLYPGTRYLRKRITR